MDSDTCLVGRSTACREVSPASHLAMNMNPVEMRPSPVLWATCIYVNS